MDAREVGRTAPHPLPVTVALIHDALKRLRVVAGESAQSNTPVTLYRGLKGMKVQGNFLQAGKGGTELAPMSTTRSLKIAMQYSASENSLLLRLHTKNFMVRGPEISFLSAFPGEAEYLLPPLTCLLEHSSRVGVPFFSSRMSWSMSSRVAVLKR